MRLGLRVTLATCLGVALAACVDLFHSTDFETACDVDAAACDPSDAGVCADPSDPSASRDACARARGEAGPD